MCKNWALWSAGMSNSVMEKAATSVLLLDNLLAQNILLTSLRLHFFLSRLLCGGCLHTSVTLYLQNGIWVTACNRIRMSRSLNNMGMRTHELQSGGSKDVIIKFFLHCFKMVLELGVFTWLIGWCFKHVFKYYPRFWHSLLLKCFCLRNDLGLYIHDLIFSITHHAVKEMQFPFGGCPPGDLSLQWYQEQMCVSGTGAKSGDLRGPWAYTRQSNCWPNYLIGLSND